MKKISITTIISVVIGVSTIVGSVFALDSRYVHAADFQKFEKEQSQRFDSVDLNFKLIRKQMLEDQLFSLDIKQNLSEGEQLQKKRLESQLKELNEEIRVLKRR